MDGRIFSPEDLPLKGGIDGAKISKMPTARSAWMRRRRSGNRGRLELANVFFCCVIIGNKRLEDFSSDGTQQVLEKFEAGTLPLAASCFRDHGPLAALAAVCGAPLACLMSL